MKFQSHHFSQGAKNANKQKNGSKSQKKGKKEKSKKEGAPMRDTDDDDWESKLDQTLDTIFLP